jgi:hypothetical protein
MNATEFYLWLNGYLEALESEGIEICKIKNIREKMESIRRPANQERVVFGPNVNQPKGYVNPDTNRPVVS